MKKLFLLILMLLFFVPMGFGEDYPPKGGRDEYPIYWYLYRHGDKLKKELDTRHFFRLRGCGCEYLVKITPDGTSEILDILDSQNKLYDKQIKKIIETTKAEAFGDEIKFDKLIVRIHMGFVSWFDSVTIYYNPKRPENERYTINISTIR